ncbi:MAG: sigma-E processing peptidase SpoIIGA [Clostridia bacterium]|nr:sigma-E processing peptidase SpoIIGA [Clostridia bacterium]
MKVYVDAVFVLNTLINAVLLFAAARVRAVPFRTLRLLAAAALGGAYAVAVYLPGMVFLGGWLWKLLTGGAMIVLAFGLHKTSFATGLVFLFISVVLCGLVFFVVNILCGRRMNGAGLYPVSFPELLLTAGLSLFCGALLWSRAATKPKERIYRAELTLNHQRFSLTALYDSGNSLRDPISGKPVDVICAETVSRALGTQAVQAIYREDLQTAMRLLKAYQPRLIPYTSVGVGSGLLIAIRPEQYTLNAQYREDTLLALSPTKLNDSGAYSILTGGRPSDTKYQKSAETTDKTGKADVHRRQRRFAAAAQGRRRAGGDRTDGAGQRNGEKEADRA